MTSTSWSISEAQELIAAMEAKAKSFGYTITLGGSVLTKGKSENDLNLFLLPNGTMRALPIDMLMWLASKFGLGKTTGSTNAAQANRNRAARAVAMIPQYDPITGAVIPATKATTHQLEFDLKGRKIEVFVV